MSKAYVIQMQAGEAFRTKRFALEWAYVSSLFVPTLHFPVIQLSTPTPTPTPQKMANHPQIEIKSGEKDAVVSSGAGFIVTLAEEGDLRPILKDALSTVYGLEDATETGPATTDDETASLSPLALFGPGFLKKRDANRVMQGQAFQVAFEEDMSESVFLHLADLLARISLDVPSLRVPVCGPRSEAELEVQEGETTEIRCVGDRLLLTFREDAPEEFFDLLQLPDMSRAASYLEETLTLKNFDGQWAQALQLHEEEPGARFYVEALAKEDRARMAEADPAWVDPAWLASYKDEVHAFTEEVSFAWEGDRLQERLLARIQELKEGGALKQGGALRLEIALSEDLAQRQEWAGALRAALKKEGVEAEIAVYNAYKQGYSWLSEEVLPALKEQGADRLKISFTPFVKEKGEEWTKEAGAIPSYVNMNLNHEGKWFEMPTRLLQEIYPIDDLLAQELDVDRDCIEFRLLEHEESWAYQLDAFRGDTPLSTFRYAPVFSERLYLDAFPGMGLVHPSTAYFRLYQDDAVIAFETLPTDLEMVWAYYQETILPKCRSYMERDRQPIFSSLKMDISLSEADEALPFRQDWLSALDSFHEDLYFVGLDYFKLASQEDFDQIIDAPGLILPLLHKSTGGPKISWSIHLPKAWAPYYEIGEEKKALSASSWDVALERIEHREGKKIAYWRATAPSTTWTHTGWEAWKSLVEKGLSTLPEEAAAVDEWVILGAEGESYTVRLPKVQKTVAMDAFAVQDEDVYSYVDYDRAMQELKATQGVEVRTLARSYQGRTLHSLEFGQTEEGFSTSYHRSYQKPTIYINARHHANEVSSTNSTFDLAKKVVCDPAWQKRLQAVNLVLLPMENPDGSAIHDLLREEHPEWIFHISRFNALGKEFAQEYFNPETIHTEAGAMQQVYERWLPDLYIDDHGVPHHEWCQQFSGYTAPAYKGFWLPRALLYGYFWYRNDRKESLPLAEELQEAIAEAFRQKEEYRNLNEDLRDRFEKYAHKWLPTLFPADYYKDLIFYWIGFEPETKKSYLTLRFPDVTVVSYTSEVADESARGAYLKDCAAAHLLNNQAMIDAMAARPLTFGGSVSAQGDGLLVRYQRNRK